MDVPVTLGDGGEPPPLTHVLSDVGTGATWQPWTRRHSASFARRELGKDGHMASLHCAPRRTPLPRDLSQPSRELLPWPPAMETRTLEGSGPVPALIRGGCRSAREGAGAQPPVKGGSRAVHGGSSLAHGNSDGHLPRASQHTRQQRPQTRLRAPALSQVAVSVWL